MLQQHRLQRETGEGGGRGEGRRDRTTETRNKQERSEGGRWWRRGRERGEFGVLLETRTKASGGRAKTAGETEK